MFEFPTAKAAMDYADTVAEASVRVSHRVVTVECFESHDEPHEVYHAAEFGGREVAP